VLCAQIALRICILGYKCHEFVGAMFPSGLADFLYRRYRMSQSDGNQLGKASHPEPGPKDPESLRLARAVGRGQIVLLCSHFERYIYAINEELVAFLNTNQVQGNRLPFFMIVCLPG
jgi:hypothetical protein